MKVTHLPDDVASAVELKFRLTPIQVNRAKQILLLGNIWYLPDGTFQVSSQSRRDHFHKVSLSPVTCTCESFIHRGTLCIHLIAALMLERTPIGLIDLGEFNHPLMKEYLLGLVPASLPDPIAERERLAKVNAPKRTEWVEELD